MMKDFFLSDNITEYVPAKNVEDILERIEKIESVLDWYVIVRYSTLHPHLHPHPHPHPHPNTCLHSEVGWIPLYFETLYELYGADRGVALKALLAMRSDMSWQEKNDI